jgi:hypothetical protein
MPRDVKPNKEQRVPCLNKRAQSGRLDHLIVDGMYRIGRQPLPTERSLQLAVEKREILEAMGMNLFMTHRRCHQQTDAAVWKSLPEEQRATWCDRALDLLKAQPELRIAFR